MSGATRKDVYTLIGYIESDLRAASAKFTEVRSMLAQGAMERSEENTLACPKCGAQLHSERALLFHDANVHGGPVVPLTEEEARA